MRFKTAVILLGATLLAVSTLPPIRQSRAAPAPGGFRAVSPHIFIPTLYPRGARLFWVTGDFQLTTDRHVPFDATGPGARLYFSWDVGKVPNATGALWQVSRIDFRRSRVGDSRIWIPMGSCSLAERRGLTVPSPWIRREFTTPGRIWNKDHVMTL